MNALLLGLDHGLQIEGSASEWKKFKAYLTDLCLREHPDLIAEELNEEAIKKSKGNDSVARKIIEVLKKKHSLKIDHLFCDPDSAQRKILGIKCFKKIAQELGYGQGLTHEQELEVDKIWKSYWDKRERFWLNKLMEQKFKKCIFLVGANHVDRFGSLLIDNGIQPLILEKDWQP